MESMFNKLLTEAPNMGVLLAVVWIFIKHLERQNAAASLRDAAQAKILAELNARSETVADKAHAVILANTIESSRNSNQLSANTSAITEMTQSMKELIKAQKRAV